ncbi:MAG: hypothetical protein WAW37_04845 [Syntrophobacteraceae bacterium]
MQILANILLYGFLAWMLYECTIVEFDPWKLFVVGFVVTLSIVITLMPGLHASTTSPGHYPYDDD